ncbi:MAG: hypothetical protein LBD46_06620 [Endomicrobium sp.]|jgi:hypothetical protein|nr:hypothetical protein [Endomicrobium sp.]
MATDKIYTEQEIIEINNAFTPQYRPFYMLLKAGKVYNEKPGAITFKERGILGDKKAADVLAQDTEIKHIAVGEKPEKKYLKILKGAEYAVSTFQDNSNAQKVDNEILDEYNKQLDSEAFTGEGTSNATVKNNGLFYSKDPDFVDKGAAAAFPTTFADRKAFIKNLAKESADGSGGGLKRIVLLGSKLPAIFGDVIGSGTATFADLLMSGRLSGEPPIEVVVPPAEINTTLGNVDAILVIDYENVLLNHGLLPQVYQRGTEARKNLTWTQYFFNSVMIEVAKKAALIKQLLTI